MASSRNSFKHGLASGQMIIPGEDSASFEALLHGLLEEHQPGSPTEELLVNEMAQSYWLSQRALRFQNECFTENGVDEKRLSLFLRYQTTHDRSFHKALSTLVRLKKCRGEACLARFVSQPDQVYAAERNRARQRAELEAGFVPQDALEGSATQARDNQFVRQNGPPARAEAA